MIDKSLLEIIVCPETSQELVFAEPELVEDDKFFLDGLFRHLFTFRRQYDPPGGCGRGAGRPGDGPR